MQLDDPRNNSFYNALPNDLKVGMHGNAQGFSLSISFLFSFPGKKSRVCEIQKRMNVSIKNLTVVLKTISILFIHLQSRFTRYFNKKRKKKQKQSCFKQTILSPNSV